MANMRGMSLIVGLILACASGASAQPQRYDPPTPITPSEEQLREINTRIDKLDQAVKLLAREGVRDPVLADIEVYLKSAQWIVKHNEFYRKDYIDWTLEALHRGMLRASIAPGPGQPVPWMVQAGSTVVRGYRSRVDGSVQPYAVTYPADYGKDAFTRYRLDVVL